MTAHDILTSSLEPELQDPDEETFLLYSQGMPSQNLGFVDPSAASVDVAVAQRDYTIHQSPAVLSSNRAGGTTGAVLWKVTPLFAEWLASPSNVLFTSSALSSASAVLELGCGISPLNALALSPRIRSCVLTDQPYVGKLIQQNIQENSHMPSSSGNSSRRGKKKPPPSPPNITFETLDWETDQITPSSPFAVDNGSFDAVIACDCVFNYALVEPFVQTCADVCRLRTVDGGDGGEKKLPCLCIVAQQLRNDEVFLSFLETFMRFFRVWRVPDRMLPEQLTSTQGFVVHIGILREL
ncbi:hypothetical protein S40285_05719 [Stachybotrys chlorohalonatus IBT 40285]|uniref:Diaminohydroxyphosphoribosylamino-pyrimidine deaminase n=1 Tax=Stachybotrys chlorohalonatus (strain IBT 40285) TaxID=1283841 RepID=A0A084QJ47_STAC4|nr:hypothetical protein S40285_05719 [Stachybotrys chlorohalonata IBT 40285]